MTTIKTPASVQDAADRLGVIGRLVTAKEWEKAAILASVVRLQDHRGRPANGSSAIYETPAEFAERGVMGLRSPASVRLYVQRWLDAHDGKYPALNRNVKLPTIDWPPREDSEGSRLSVNPEQAVEQLIERHGPEAIAVAVRRPDVADAVVRDREANVQTIRASARSVPSQGTKRSGNGFLEESAQALANVLFDWGVLQVEQGSKDLHDRLINQRIRENEWLPGLKEQIALKVAEAIDRLEKVQVVLNSEVTDEDLHDLLNS